MDSVTLTHSDQASTKATPFQNNSAWTGVPDRVPPTLFGSSFTFVVNGAVIESDVAEAAALSPFVREQLSVDGCAREFVLWDSSVGSSAIVSLKHFFSGSVISVGRSERVLSGYFGNCALECDFLSCGKAGIAGSLSGSVIERRISF
jgi:hypothetical protein